MSSHLLEKTGLTPALIRAARRKARAEEKSMREYVRSLIERDMLADRSFDEILKPIRRDFRKSGIREAQLDRIVERAREANVD